MAARKKAATSGATNSVIGSDRSAATDKVLKAQDPENAPASNSPEAERAEKRTTSSTGDGPQTDHPEVVAANVAHGVEED